MPSRYLRDLNNAVGAPRQAPSVPHASILNPGLDPTLAAGGATGIAATTASADVLGGGDAIGVAAIAGSAQLVEAGSAASISATTATTEEDVENGAVIGIGAANESGAVVIASGAAAGSASGAASPSLIPAAAAVGVSVGSASIEDDVENGSAVGSSGVGASAVLAIAADAVGSSTATANPLGGTAVSEADAFSDGVVMVSSGDAGGSAFTSATALVVQAEQPATAQLDYGPFEIRMPRRRERIPIEPSAPIALPPAKARPIEASGRAIGSSHATAAALQVIPAPAVALVDDIAPAWSTEDDLDMLLLADLAA